MKTFNEWLSNLNETVTFRVSNIDKSQVKKDLHFLTSDLALEMSESFPQEFSYATQQSGQYYGDLITPDGDYYSEGKEEINFYSGFFPEESRKKMLQAILYMLPEHRMKLNGSVREDNSRLNQVSVYRIPVAVGAQKNPAPELNVASQNAREILKMLNIHGDLCGDIDVRELNMKLNMITDFHKRMTDRAPEIDHNFINFGLSIDQIERYIQTLQSIVDWALHNNYDTISYC